MIWKFRTRIEFNHCDPAGIVFYPRYFEMTNSVAENFFRDVAGRSYAQMMAAQQGVPTAKLESEFLRPSRLDDILEWRMEVRDIGRSSVTLSLQAWCEDEHRVSIRLVLVFVAADAKGIRPAPWPDDVRERIHRFKEAADA